MFWYADKILNSSDIAELYNAGAGYNPFTALTRYLDITATNAWNASSILSLSALINGTYYHTTNGTINTGIPSNDTSLYNITLNASGYATRIYEDYNVSLNLEAELYPQNSILINIYSEGTGLPIYDNITIIITGNASEDTYYTTNATYFIDNLTAGTYTVKFNGDNYTLTSYTVTVLEGGTQILNAYLSGSTDTVIMIYLDDDSGTTLEEVSASMSRLINGTWTVIQSKSSDITGRVQFSYTVGVAYRFTSTLTNYDTKIFTLDPILFDSYNVKMNKETSITTAPAYQGVSIIISPSQYYNDQQNNFTITFNSPNGTLTAYNYNITFPGGSVADSGVNAYGGTFSSDVNITGAGWLDTVNLTYGYDTSIGTPKSHYKLYSIIDPTLDEGLFIKNMDNDYGLGIFERILATMIVVIIVTGIISLLAGILVGMPIGLIIMGYFTIIGFMPLWATLPSLFVAFIILATRSS